MCLIVTSSTWYLVVGVIGILTALHEGGARPFFSFYVMINDGHVDDITYG